MKTYLTNIETRRHRIGFEGSHGREDFRIDGHPAAVSHEWLDETGENLLVLLEGRSYDFRIEEGNGELVLTYAGRRYRGTVIDERLADLKRRAGIPDGPAGRTVVKAPMPGLVVKILIKVGAAVRKGDRLLVLEAMKMENDVKAPRDGTVAAISVKPGEPVNGGAELMVIA